MKTQVSGSLSLDLSQLVEDVINETVGALQLDLRKTAERLDRLTAVVSSSLLDDRSAAGVLNLALTGEWSHGGDLVDRLAGYGVRLVRMDAVQSADQIDLPQAAH